MATTRACGRCFVGVALELDAFLEVDEVELDLIGTAREREIGDDDVEERRFSRAGFARKQRVLARAFADGEVLVLRRAGAADGDFQFVRCVVRPHFLGLRGDLRERHLDAVRVDAALADFVNEFDREFGAGRFVEDDGVVRTREFLVENEVLLFASNADAVFPQLIGNETVGRRLALIPMDEREDAAARAAAGDALQPLHRDLAEVRREVRDDEEVVFFRDAAGLLVVFGDRRVFVAQIHLDDLLDVLAQLGEPLLDLVALRPDAAVDEAFLVVGEVHQAGEVLAEPDRVDDGERELARRRGRKQAEDDVVQRTEHRGAAGVFGFKKERTVVGERQRKRKRNLRRAGERKARTFRESLGIFREIHVDAREFYGGRKVGGRIPRLDIALIPRGKTHRGRGVHRFDVAVDRSDVALPVRFERIPSGLFLGGDGSHLGVMRFGEFAFARSFLVPVLLQSGGPHGFDPLKFPVGDFFEFLQQSPRLFLGLFTRGIFKFRLDDGRPLPLLLNLRGRGIELLLDALAILLVLCLRGTMREGMGPVRLVNRGRECGRFRLGLLKAHAVQKHDGSHNAQAGNSACRSDRTVTNQKDSKHDDRDPRKQRNEAKNAG